MFTGEVLVWAGPSPASGGGVKDGPSPPGPSLLAPALAPLCPVGQETDRHLSGRWIWFSRTLGCNASHPTYSHPELIGSGV